METNHSTTWQLALVSIVTVAVLVPFAGKAFNIDEPLFIWTAEQILNNPLNFYGFSVNWYGVDLPMYEVMKNPPLGAYFIALAAAISGFGEWALHCFFLIPAVGVSTGTFLIAKRFTASPLAATLTAVFTPAFMVSASTVMCDVLMLAFWVWAVFFWLRGTDEEGGRGSMLAAALLITLSALTKYFGISLLALLAAYSLSSRHELKRWLPWLLIPVIALAGYQLLTASMYGRGLLLDATAYASGVRKLIVFSELGNLYTGLAFVGGTLLSVILVSNGLWKRPTMGMCAAFIVVSMAVLHLSGGLGNADFTVSGGTNWLLIFELSAFAFAGIYLIALTLGELRRFERGASVLLFCWIMGTVCFAVFFNWSINGRTLLPAAPAASILLWRTLDRSGVSPARSYAGLIVALLVSLTVLAADASLANASRSAARYMTDTYRERTGTLWFQGHWGFQYYMEAGGGKPLDLFKKRIRKNDIAVRPDNNTNLRLLKEKNWALLEEKVFPVFPLAATMIRAPASAGFYSSSWGPAPFVMGISQDELYVAKAARRRIFSR